jgi:nucleosome binding factor SPN SPT16 subunit
MNVQINGENFLRRLERVSTHWNTRKELWGNADAICFAFGSASSEPVAYSKHAAVHLYLLGWEFSETLMILVGNTFFFLSASKKCGMLEAALERARSSRIKVEFIRKSKDEVENKQHFAKIIAAVKKSGQKLGMLQENMQGTLVPSFVAEVEQKDLQIVDVSEGLSCMLSVKEEDEMVSSLGCTMSSIQHRSDLCTEICKDSMYFNEQDYEARLGHSTGTNHRPRGADNTQGPRGSC